ncbi:MAG: phosphoethanolamine transferase [Succinivibrionaceae bacterium]
MIFNIFKKKIKIRAIKYLLTIITTAILFSPIIFSFCYLLNWSFGNPILDSDAILAVYQTNILEAHSYFVDFAHKKRFIELLVGSLILIFLSYKMNSNIDLASFKTGGKNFLLIIIGFVVSIVVLYKYSSNMVTEPLVKANETLEQYKIFNNLKNQRKDIIKKINANDEGFKGTYVLVIGESESRTQMGVYGYEKDTTPWQSSIKNSINSIFFENAFSCHTHTVPVLTYALTQKNQYDNKNDDWEKTASLVDIVKYSGKFNTSWISNQGKIGIYETPISSIADSADQKKWTEIDWTDPAKNIYDGELIEYLKTINLNSEKKLIVIHLMGSHSSYTDRYPPLYTKFTGDSDYLNTYNNSVYYNDHVLKMIYETVKNIPDFKSMIYFSDHGEDPYMMLGHNSAQFTWDMAKIPLWMIFSDSYIKEHSDIIKTLRLHINQPFTNDMMFDTVLGVFGITNNEYYNPLNDLSSSSYNHSFLDLKTLYGKKSLKEMLTKDELKKVWLHRVNSPKKLLELGNKYHGLEFDVVFHEDLNDFENSHDKSEIVQYFLRNQLEILKLKNWNNKRLWIDFKNLTHQNKYNAEKRLSELIEEFRIKKENCYVESNNWEDLKIFKENGWKTSYYFPYYNLSKLSSDEINEIKVLTKKITDSGNINAISFAQEYYDFVNSMELNKNVDLLTWFNRVENQDFVKFEKYHYVLKNPRIKAILVKELGHYSR